MADQTDATAADQAGSRGQVRRDHVTVHRRPLTGEPGPAEPEGGQGQASARARAPINQRWKAVLGAAGMVAGSIALTLLIRRIPGGRLFR